MNSKEISDDKVYVLLVVYVNNLLKKYVSAPLRTQGEY